MRDELQRRLAAGPAQFPHTLDPVRDRLLLIEAAPERLREASFLDQRLLSADLKGGWALMPDVIAAAPAHQRDDAHYIFHIGHVGSTLLSRLLGELPGVFALREPLVLRGLAEAAAGLGRSDAPWSAEMHDARCAVLRRLLARTPEPGSRALIKATSFVSEVAPRLVTAGARAVFLYVRPESYLRTILAGENSRVELGLLTPSRLTRLAARLGDIEWRHWTLAEAERAALGWATEMTSLVAAARALPGDSVLWLDFDAMLADPATALRDVAAHFGLALDLDEAARIVAGPIMRRYSKAPEHDYSPALRRRLLEQAGRANGTAIVQSLAWLDRAAAAHPAIAEAMARAERSGDVQAD